MATKIDRGGQKGKLKVRVVDFEVEGDDATLQEGLRSITAALTRHSPNGARVLSAAKSSPADLVEGAQRELPFDSEVEVDAQSDEPETIAPQQARSRPPQKPRAPKVIELDLVKGELPLKTFIEAKKPGADTERFLVIAYWLKEHRQIGEITIDHIYTCYKFMGWNTPTNPAQVLTDLKRKRGTLDKGQGVGAYAINHIGENVVRDLNKVA